MISALLELIRWKNIVLLVISLWIAQYFLLTPTLDTVPLAFYTYALATIFFTASGNIINDYFDVEIDTFNKPNNVIVGNKVSKKQTKLLYSAFLVFGVIATILTIYFSQQLISFISLLLFVAISLFVYSKLLKTNGFVGNVLIAFLTALVLLTLILLNPNINTNQLQWLVLLSVFSFSLNLARELIKDLEDIKGDTANGRKTLPITKGIHFSKKSYFAIVTLTLAVLVMVIVNERFIIKIYFSIFTLLPTLYTIYLVHKATSTKHYAFISSVLKIIIALGIFSPIIISITC